MKKRIIIYSMFFILLLSSFYIFLFAGTNNWKQKPSVISHVRSFDFIDQDSSRFTLGNIQGKVCVVEYFFTTCESICPAMNSNMNTIYEKFRNEPDFLILSHTCNPETDSPEVLKAYADSLQIDTRKWIFITGNKEKLYTAARNSYLLDDKNNSVGSIDDQFIHTQFFALVDKNGDVRGQAYDGLDKNDIEKLKKDIRTLLNEKAGHTAFVNSIFQ